MQEYDLVVVGSGPAGRRGAIQAAKLGRKVLVVEQGKRVGGVSVHTGTIPSKTLRETALNLSGWRERGFYGRAYRVKQEITSAVRWAPSTHCSGTDKVRSRDTRLMSPTGSASSRAAHSSGNP